MSTEISLPAGFGAVPAAFADATSANDELGAGVASSYAVMGYRGKVWSIKFQGEEKQLMRDDGDGPRNSIEVVLLKASPAVSKIFYRAGYVEGSNAAPDCWSANGQTPDASVQNKVHATCADCPMNAWGSRVTEAGKQGKACADSRRVAIAPLADIDNDLFGGPMLLRIPAASLKDLKAYGDLLNSYHFPYYAVATKVNFDPQEAYPKFVFTAMRPLTEDEAKKVAGLREDRRVGVVLSETQAAAGAGDAAPTPAVASSPFGQSVGGAAPAAQTAQPVQTTQPAQTTQTTQAPKADPFSTKPAETKPSEPTPTQAAAPVTQPAAETPAAGVGSPESFDSLLDGLLD